MGVHLGVRLKSRGFCARQIAFSKEKHHYQLRKQGRYYVGNCVGTVIGTAEVGELISQELGWAAMLCNQAIAGHNNEEVRNKVEAWVKSPCIRQLGRIMNHTFLLIGLSRFDAYGNDFGWGKPVAIRRGIATKFDSAYPGREGGSSLDLVCCLSPETMEALELDEEFMSFVSLTM